MSKTFFWNFRPKNVRHFETGGHLEKIFLRQRPFIIRFKSMKYEVNLSNGIRVIIRMKWWKKFFGSEILPAILKPAAILITIFSSRSRIILSYILVKFKGNRWRGIRVMLRTIKCNGRTGGFPLSLWTSVWWDNNPVCPCSSLSS